MTVAVVAEPDLRERVRCVRTLACQTRLSALGAATWDELEQLFQEEPKVAVVFYNSLLPGAPEDAVDRISQHTEHLVLSGTAEDTAKKVNGVVYLHAPIPEESLILMARSVGGQTEARMCCMPIDLIQMLCISNDSKVLVISQDDADIGVIEVRNGEVWTAFDGLGVGEESFARLIRPEMRARMSPSRCSPKDRTIFAGLHELLLESLRRLDEGQVSSPPKLSATRLAAELDSPEELAAKINELALQARRLLTVRDYNEAARALALLAELDPSSQLVRANLEQLHRLGYPK
jgi:hypothetical protein